MKLYVIVYKTYNLIYIHIYIHIDVYSILLTHTVSHIYTC